MGAATGPGRPSELCTGRPGRSPVGTPDPAAVLGPDQETSAVTRSMPAAAPKSRDRWGFRRWGMGSIIGDRTGRRGPIGPIRRVEQHRPGVPAGGSAAAGPAHGPGVETAVAADGRGATTAYPELVLQRLQARVQLAVDENAPRPAHRRQPGGDVDDRAEDVAE